MTQNILHIIENVLSSPSSFLHFHSSQHDHFKYRHRPTCQAQSSVPQQEAGPSALSYISEMVGSFSQRDQPLPDGLLGLHRSVDNLYKEPNDINSLLSKPCLLDLRFGLCRQRTQNPLTPLRRHALQSILHKTDSIGGSYCLPQRTMASCKLATRTLDALRTKATMALVTQRSSSFQECSPRAISASGCTPSQKSWASGF